MSAVEPLLLGHRVNSCGDDAAVCNDTPTAEAALFADALAHDHKGEVQVHTKSEPDDGDGSTYAFSWRVFFRFSGPGLLMAIAYVDPGNIESDLQSGIYGGYSLGWVLLLSTVIGWLLQTLSLRQGVVMGKDLGTACREEYPRPARLAIWLCIEVAIVGSDIQEVVGSAIALQLLFGLPLWIGVVLTGFDTFTFLLLERFGIRKLEAVFGALIATMTTSFLAVFFIGSPAYGSIGLGLVKPIVHGQAVTQAIGTLGAVVMPHNLFLHSSLVQSRRIDRTKRGRVDEALVYYTLEAAFSLFVSFVINLAVLSVFARHFFRPLDSECAAGVLCKDVGLAEAGDVLEQGFGGKAGKYIWGVGLLAAGQSSTMTGTFAGQYLMNGMLDLKLSLAKRTALTRSIAVVPAVIVAIVAQSALDRLDEWLNCLQSLVLPAAVIPLVVICSEAKLLGPYKLGRTVKVITWLLVVVVILINFYLIGDFAAATFPHTWWVYLLLAVFAVLYLAACLYVMFTRVGEHVGDPTVGVAERRAVDQLHRRLHNDDGLHHNRQSSQAAPSHAQPHSCHCVTVPWWTRGTVTATTTPPQVVVNGVPA